jgi:hypothetical protein
MAAAEESELNVILRSLQSVKPGFTKKAKLRSILQSQPDHILNQIVNPEYSSIIQNIKKEKEREREKLEESEKDYTAEQSEPEQKEISLEDALSLSLDRTDIAGIPLPDGRYLSNKFYQNIAQLIRDKRYEPIGKGAEGTTFIYENRFYIKCVELEKRWKQQLELPRNEITKIINPSVEKVNAFKREMNTNLLLTTRIPDVISKCFGSYINYQFNETGFDCTGFFVYEYLPGMTLGSWIKKRNSQNQSIVKSIITSLRTCIVSLHQAGYVHRDVKPDNIFLVSSSVKGFTFVKCILIDLGETLPIGAPINRTKVRGDVTYNPMNNSAYKYDRNTVVPEHNLYSLSQIIRLPSKSSTGEYDNVGLEMNETYQSEGGNRRKRRTKKNNRRKNRTRRSN